MHLLPRSFLSQRCRVRSASAGPALLLVALLPFPASVAAGQVRQPTTPNTVTVPPVIGMSLETAAQVMRRAGLTSITVDSITIPSTTSSVRAPPAIGTVVRQVPEGGSVVRPGQPIVLTVAATPGREPQIQDVQEVRVRVPDLVGTSPPEAARLLRESRLVLATVDTVERTGAGGAIVEQKPVAGEIVRAGSGVAVAVAVGPRLIAVPNVVGRGTREADAILRRAGLELASVRSEVRPEGVGLVTSQSPAGGRRVPAGSGVDLVVSVAPNQVPVPSLIGRSRGDAELLVRRAGLALAGVGEVEVPEGAGLVVRQAPGAGSSVAPGSSVRFDVGIPPPPAETQIPDTQLPDSLLPGTQLPDEPPGPAPNPVAVRSVAVPALAGRTAGAADSVLRQAGLAAGTIAYVRGAGEPGLVTSQDPEPGVLVAPGSPVAFSVTQGGMSARRFAYPVLGLLLAALTVGMLRRRRSSGGGDEPPPDPPSVRPRWEPHRGRPSSDLELTGPLIDGQALHMRTGRGSTNVELRLADHLALEEPFHAER